MANPFLMDDDLASGTDMTSNPFLMESGGDEEEDDYMVDNPFLANQATNPFAGFGEPDEDEIPTTTTIDFFGNENTEPVVTSADLFFSNSMSDTVMTTTVNQFNNFGEQISPQKPIDLHIKNPHTVAANEDSMSNYSSDDELKMKKKPPPPRPVPPPSKATQDLIMSVANELDQASNHLLDRLPATRTPSPVSMRDFHSPCPTPDMQFGDFLDISGTQKSNQFDDDLMSEDVSNDNPFQMDDEPEVKNDVSKNHPPRPPPPRPTPPQKTSPPSYPPLPTQHTQPVPPPTQIHHQEDLFDIFGTNDTKPKVPVPPKSKEDILSLYSNQSSANYETANKTMPDFLSGDILDDVIPDFTNNVMAQQQQPQPAYPTITSPKVTPPECDYQPPTELTPPDELHHTMSDEITQQPDIYSDNSSNHAGSSVTGSILNMEEVFTAESTQISDVNPFADVSEVGNENFVQEDVSQTFYEEPVAQQPFYEEPVVQQPFYEEPVAQQPFYEEPVVQQPFYEEPVPIQQPLFEDPVAQQPFYEEPVTQQPLFEEPVVQQPFYEEPVPIQQPFYEEPVPIQQPLFEEPVAQQPFYEEPVDQQPFYVEPVQQQPLFEEPVVQQPFYEQPVAAPHIEPQIIEPIKPVKPYRQPPPPPVRTTPFTQPIHAAKPIEVDILGFGAPAKTPKNDEFDAFAAKFDSVEKPKVTNIFMEPVATNAFDTADAWGDATTTVNETTSSDGFGNDEGFDSFLALAEPPARESTPFDRKDSKDSDEGKEFNVFIRPKEPDSFQGAITPILAPPPRSSQNNSVYSGDSSPRVNPFDKGFEDAHSVEGIPPPIEIKPPNLERGDSLESPQTPLFDDDVSQPLEDFPRITYTGPGWEMQLRQPNKKRITAQRFWKKIHMRLAMQGDNPVLQLLNAPNDKEPFQELPLQACYSVSDVSAQQFDQFGKIFTVKLQYIFYKERPGVRPGQVTKAERITSKLSQFAAYAIQGDYQGVKEFGSDLKKLGIPVEHAPQVSELFKLGSLTYEDMKQFSMCIDEALFKLDVHRDRALNYKTEEVQITAVDEIFVEQDAEGHVLKQIARVRLFFLGFMSGMPYIELGVNDLWRQGKEVVGRHDIIPVVTEEWIRLEGVEFHNCVNQEEYERTRTIKFQPPDACYIELMRFRVRPPKNRELPLQLKATWCVTGNKVDLRADVLVPGFASRKLGQIPCEDVMIRFPIPECWIYLFRTEKHFRYGSVKSAHKRTGKVKGIERILGSAGVDTLQESLIEVTSGSAKYEHQHRALVWRCPRLPKEGQGAYTTHQLVCRLALTSFDQIPEQLAPHAYVEFTMPATQVSHTTVRSVSIQESESDDPPEKYVRYLARHEYKVGIEHTHGETTNAYAAATMTKPATIREEPPPKPAVSPGLALSDSDSDSN